MPLYRFAGHRTQPPAWAERKGEDGLLEYQVKNNRKSIDGLRALEWANREPGIETLEPESLKPELLLFDFGGVLVEFAGPTSSAVTSAGRRRPRSSLTAGRSARTRRVRARQLSAAEWAERFIHDWDVDLRPDASSQRSGPGRRRVLPGARDLLEQLRPHYRAGRLSNSNELHWERNANELRILELFEFAILHQVGLCKPDPAIFKRWRFERAHVSSPDAIVFFDDLAANVEAARSTGLRAYQVRGVDELRARLVGERLL